MKKLLTAFALLAIASGAQGATREQALKLLKDSRQLENCTDPTEVTAASIEVVTLGATAQLFEASCVTGAYNSMAFYVLASSGKMGLLSFAEPTMNEAGEVTGYRTTQGIGYGGHAASGGKVTITSFHKFRGLGDSFSLGTYVLRKNELTEDYETVLRKYELDTTEDGLQNPKAIFEGAAE